jgi:RNA polymerase sigma-70 factor (ECF subfamily)
VDPGSEERLALEARGGSRNALEELWRLHEPRIVQMCRWLCASESSSAVADLVQETFLRMHENIGRYDARRPFRPWLYAIARNVVIDHLRRRGAWWDIEKELSGRGAGASGPVQDPVVRSESEERLRQAVRRLPEPYRLVVLYSVWADLPPAEIAELLEIPAGRVRVHLYRALRKLQAELGEP